jgi:hypothetical protein
MRSLIAAVAAFFLISTSVLAQEGSFKNSNPDIDKYSFAKSFIAGLSYYARVAERQTKEEGTVIDGQKEAEVIRNYIDNRTLDNSELRIAKSYLVKYFESPNGLIRSVAMDTVAVYDRLLAMSVRERDLWKIFERYKSTGKPSDFNEEEFSRQQIALAREKKEVAKELVRQAVLSTKAMLSAERCESEGCQDLALTQDERDKLVKKLDSFVKTNMDWGMKPGQSTIEACVASIREVLEDSVYASQPQRSK